MSYFFKSLFCLLIILGATIASAAPKDVEQQLEEYSAIYSKYRTKLDVASFKVMKGFSVKKTHIPELYEVKMPQLIDYITEEMEYYKDQDSYEYRKEAFTRLVAEAEKRFQDQRFSLNVWHNLTLLSAALLTDESDGEFAALKRSALQLRGEELEEADPFGWMQLDVLNQLIEARGELAGLSLVAQPKGRFAFEAVIFARSGILPLKPFIRSFEDQMGLAAMPSPYEVTGVHGGFVKGPLQFLAHDLLHWIVAQTFTKRTWATIGQIRKLIGQEVTDEELTAFFMISHELFGTVEKNTDNVRKLRKKDAKAAAKLAGQGLSPFTEAEMNSVTRLITSMRLFNLNSYEFLVLPDVTGSAEFVDSCLQDIGSGWKVALEYDESSNARSNVREDGLQRTMKENGEFVVEAPAERLDDHGAVLEAGTVRLRYVPVDDFSFAATLYVEIVNAAGQEQSMQVESDQFSGTHPYFARRNYAVDYAELLGVELEGKGYPSDNDMRCVMEAIDELLVQFARKYMQSAACSSFETPQSRGLDG